MVMVQVRTVYEIDPRSGRFPLESVWKIGLRWGFVWGLAVIQALDVDRAEPWPDGQDREEDQALLV